MRILISSYSFGAGRGSEAGVGWNVAAGLAARGHEVCVVTTSEFRHLNVPALEKARLPIQLVEFDAGLKQFNSSRAYGVWQRAVGAELRRLTQEQKFDLIHHVTFNQYRALHDVFEVDLPYVVGPLGGAETVHPRFWKEVPLKMALKEAVRYMPWDVLPLKKRVAAAAAPGVVLASTPQTAGRLKNYAGIDGVKLTPVISLHDEEIATAAPQRGQERYFVFDGGVRPEKGLKLFLRALARLWNAGMRVPVKVAAVAEDARSGVLRYVKGLGLPESAVEMMPFMPRVELLEVLRGASGFVSVGFRDAGCMALLEAVGLGIPSVCLDVSGQHWLPAEYAIKVPVTVDNMEQAIAEAMEKLLHQPERTPDWHRERAEWLREHMTWRVRLDYFEQVYSELVQQDR